MKRKTIINLLFILAAGLVLANVIIMIVTDNDLTYLYPIGLLVFAGAVMMQQADKKKEEEANKEMEEQEQ